MYNAMDDRHILYTCLVVYPSVSKAMKCRLPTQSTVYCTGGNKKMERSRSAVLESTSERQCMLKSNKKQKSDKPQVYTGQK